MNIKDLVKNNYATFAYYRQKHLYYSVTTELDGSYLFPVPIDDLQEATVNIQEKAIHLMRYIRIAKEEGTLIKEGYLAVE